MDENAWPTSLAVPAANEVRRSWAVTIAAPPVGNVVVIPLVLRKHGVDTTRHPASF
jgi:hypothetical protein